MPCYNLRAYEENSICGKETRVLLSTIKPYKASLVACWLKSLLETAGVYTSLFSPHFIRGASSSAAENVGVTNNEILKVHWSSESVFLRFYYRISDNPSYGRAVLLSNSATNNIVRLCLLKYTI